nr:hypothetical protein CFP56_10694 [Quercus suber]
MISFWLGFGSGAWLEVMSLKSSDHGGLEGDLSLRGRLEGMRRVLAENMERVRLRVKPSWSGGIDVQR